MKVKNLILELQAIEKEYPNKEIELFDSDSGKSFVIKDIDAVNDKVFLDFYGQEGQK